MGPPGATEPLRTTRRRIPGEELALLTFAVLTLVLPSWWSGAWSGDDGAADLSIVHEPLEPLVIDVESAPWYEWCLLEGIGEARARRIAEFVEANRPLESADDLRRVSGLPSGWFETASEFLYFRGQAVAAGRGADPRKNDEVSACD